MAKNTEPDLAAAAVTLARIEQLTRRLRTQLGDLPVSTGPAGRRRVTLREAALRSLTPGTWMSLTDWERAMTAHGYAPPKDAKRDDQTRRSLASLAARNRHLIDADGRGHYRPAPVQDADPLIR